MNPNEPNQSTDLNTEQSNVPTAQPAVNSNKKLIIVAASAVGLLLLILIILLALVLGKKDKTDTTRIAPIPSSSTNSNSSPNKTPAMKIVKTYQTSNPKIDIVIYEPKQTGSNTTINYSIRNICSGCQDSIFASFAAITGYTSDKKTFLLDETAGQKYNPIVDQDDNVLMTPSCSKNLKAGEKIDCFIAFTKVPAGTSVSFVAGQLKIDGILVN